jgi:hypothetical protein
MFFFNVTELLTDSNFSDAKLKSNGSRSTINKILAKLMYKVFFIMNVSSNGPESDSTDVALINFGIENVINIDFLCKQTKKMMKVIRFISIVVGRQALIIGEYYRFHDLK